MTYNEALEFDYRIQVDTAEWQLDILQEAAEHIRSAVNLLAASDTRTEYDHYGVLTEIMDSALDEAATIEKALAREDERDREALSREYERST